jgi:hypothetical protein
MSTVSAPAGIDFTPANAGCARVSAAMIIATTATTTGTGTTGYGVASMRDE